MCRHMLYIFGCPLWDYLLLLFLYLIYWHITAGLNARARVCIRRPTIYCGLWFGPILLSCGHGYYLWLAYLPLGPPMTLNPDLIWSPKHTVQLSPDATTQRSGWETQTLTHSPLTSSHSAHCRAATNTEDRVRLVKGKTFSVHELGCGIWTHHLKNLKIKSDALTGTQHDQKFGVEDARLVQVWC